MLAKLYCATCNRRLGLDCSIKLLHWISAALPSIFRQIRIPAKLFSETICSWHWLRRFSTLVQPISPIWTPKELKPSVKDVDFLIKRYQRIRHQSLDAIIFRRKTQNRGEKRVSRIWNYNLDPCAENLWAERWQKFKIGRSENEKVGFTEEKVNVIVLIGFPRAI